jgi:MFS family permease
MTVTITRSLGRRLLPLFAGVALQNMMLWPPVEKLFLTQIGFTAASVGLVAAAYAAVSPLLDVPTGILADRWSRRGVLVLSSVALAACSLVGGLSHSVPLYLLSAVLLGVYFAMYSGTVEAVLYDTVVEHTGGSDGYQKWLGRVRLVESGTLVAGSLAGGWLASLVGPRVTYFLSVPFVLLAIVGYLRFSEPQLHRANERVPLRAQVSITYRTITRRGTVPPLVVLGALAAVTLQVVVEFGPLWLVALAAPAVLFGPYWAALMSSLGLGGLLAGWLRLDRPGPLAVVCVLMVAASVVLNTTDSLPLVIAAQSVLGSVVVAVGIHADALLHDAVPSSVRAGVTSGVGTLTWLGFLPVALAFGWVSARFGLHTSGWVITATTVAVAVLLLRALRRTSTVTAESDVPDAALAAEMLTA